MASEKIIRVMVYCNDCAVYPVIVTGLAREERLCGQCGNMKNRWTPEGVLVVWQEQRVRDSEPRIESVCRYCGLGITSALSVFGDVFWVHKGNGLRHCGLPSKRTATPVEDGVFGLWDERRVWKTGFKVEYGCEERVEVRVDGFAGSSTTSRLNHIDVIPLRGRRFHIIDDGSITFRGEQRVPEGTNANGRQYGEVKQAEKRETCQVHADVFEGGVMML